MPRGGYGKCFGWQCAAEDDDIDATEIGYSRLDNENSNDHVTLGNYNRRRPEGEAGDDENDYFRPADSYQWNPADRDQGQEAAEGAEDQGRENYTGIHIHGPKSKRKSKPKGFRARLRHYLHSSWKWFKRGFVMVSPTVMTFNPTTAYVVTTSARRAVAQGRARSVVDL